MTTDLTRDPLIGTRIGRYQVQELIGRGGMGVVYKARDDRLARTVAVKVLLPELSLDPVFRERFIRESKIAASMMHPNVVAIFEADEARGLLYLAMRHVEGIDLKSLIQREGALGLERTVQIMSQVGSALDAAHDRGLIHRDVKPANVLIETEKGTERAFLTDFGLAKTLTGQTSLTGVGEFLGTPHYMAPEQIRGEPLDRRTDVYSLGCVLYECLTGEVPFKRQGDVAGVYAVFAHLEEPVPRPSALERELPINVDLVVATAMAKRPATRYATCGDLVSAMESVVRPSQTASRARPRATRRALARVARAGAERRRWRTVPLAAAILGVVLVASLLFALHGSPTGPSRPPATGESAFDRLQAHPDEFGRWLRTQRGHAVVISFWGSWCPPCTEEAPVLGRAWDFYRGLGVRFYAIDEKDNPAQAAAFRRKYGLTYPNIADPPARAGEMGSILTQLGYFAIPTTLIVDQQGKVRRHISGPVSPSFLETDLNKILRGLLRRAPHPGPQLPRVDASIHVGTQPIGVAARGNTAWVLDSRGAAGGNSFSDRAKTLWRVDTGANRVAGKVRLPFAAGGVVTRKKAVLVVGDGIVEINRQTSRIAHAWRLPQSAFGADFVVPAFGSWWVPTVDGVVRINPRTHREATIQLRPGVWSRGIAAGYGAVWVANPNDDSVSRIDPQKGRVTRVIKVGRLPGNIATGEGSVWVTNLNSGTVSRIDPDSNSVEATIRIGPAQAESPTDIVAARGAIWVTAPDSRVAMIDPADDRIVRRVRVAGLPDTLNYGAGTLWVTYLKNDLVQRIEL